MDRYIAQHSPPRTLHKSQAGAHKDSRAATHKTIAMHRYIAQHSPPRTLHKSQAGAHKDSRAATHKTIAALHLNTGHTGTLLCFNHTSSSLPQEACAHAPCPSTQTHPEAAAILPEALPCSVLYYRRSSNTSSKALSWRPHPATHLSCSAHAHQVAASALHSSRSLAALTVSGWDSPSACMGRGTDECSDCWRSCTRGRDLFQRAVAAAHKVGSPSFSCSRSLLACSALLLFSLPRIAHGWGVV